MERKRAYRVNCLLLDSWQGAAEPATHLTVSLLTRSEGLLEPATPLTVSLLTRSEGLLEPATPLTVSLLTRSEGLLEPLSSLPARAHHSPFTVPLSPPVLLCAPDAPWHNILLLLFIYFCGT
eukprot:3594615-Pyramimonas_sp.AAC.1